MSASETWWCDSPGTDDDVVLSSRVRLARNLANFPFPPKFRGTDGERIRAIVFDAFNHLEGGDSYHSFCVEQLTPEGKAILSNQGILEPVQDDKSYGLMLRSDGKISCTINICDHVRISVLTPGLDFALSEGRYVDAGLQKSVQFAASYDFGYLTSSVFDAGSGMKLSVRMHLPALTMLGKIGAVGDTLGKKGFSFTATYGLGGKGSSLGAFYTAASRNCRAGTEFDQVASMQSAIQQVVEQEHAAREQCLRDMPTTLRNTVYRAWALSRYSTLMDVKEAIETLGGLALGLDTKLLSGAMDPLPGLLIRIQLGHIELPLKECADAASSAFQPDADKGAQLRALILKENGDALDIVS